MRASGAWVAVRWQGGAHGADARGIGGDAVRQPGALVAIGVQWTVMAFDDR
jgi:hypothetical protein